MDEFRSYQPGIRERIVSMVFRPTRTSGIPEDLELPEGFLDEMVTSTWVELSFLDRLALIFVGRIVVTERTLTEFKLGSTQSNGTGLLVAAEKL